MYGPEGFCRTSLNPSHRSMGNEAIGLANRREIVDDLTELLQVLPDSIRTAIEAEEDHERLIEIVLDLGRPPEARFADRYTLLSEEPIAADDLEAVIARVGSFGPDNRAGIERTLHRISGMRNREGRIVGVTCRVGRAVFGTIEIIRDVLETGKSILLLGRPGVGKTTLLREVARVVADEFERRVIVVDTSNEIAGDGDVPHPAIGRARRMQVPKGVRQADVMIEAVENHMPEVIVIDEIGTAAEAEAARTIAERGVQLVGTAHGNTLENLVLNPTLADLIGGVQVVTLGDEEARKRGTQKSVLERKAPPTFDVVVEIQERDQVAIHHDVAQTVDALLRGAEPVPEVRRRSGDGSVDVIQASNLEELRVDADSEIEFHNARFGAEAPQRRRNGRPIKVYPYAVSRQRLENAIRDARAPFEVTKFLQEADVVVTVRGQYRKMPKRLREAEQKGLPIRVVRSNTQAQFHAFVEALRSSLTDDAW